MTFKFFNRFHLPKQERFLLIAPIAYLIWDYMLLNARGPNWMMVPQDLSYNYLLNGLNVINGDVIGSLIHPALTTIGYIAAITWLVHFFIGSGHIAIDVIANPEFYFSFSVYSIMLLTAACIFYMGKWSYQGLRNVWLVLFLQAFIFLSPATSMVMNSFASPESMVFMLALLQTGLTLRLLGSKYNSEVEFYKYILAMVIICSAAVASKFIALPLLIIPFLILPNWRLKLVYSILIFLGLLISLSPIILVEAHRIQFLSDMHALTQSAISESQNRSAGSSISRYINNIVPIHSSFPLFQYILLFIISLLLFVIIYRPFWRFIAKSSPQILRIFLVSEIVCIIAFIFILGRPKAHYLVPFIFLQGISITTFLYMASEYISHTHSHNTKNLALITKVVLAMILGIIFGFNLFSNSNGLPVLKDVNAIAKQMYERSYELPGNNAIITAIQASNIPTALYHAHATSRQLHWENLSKVVPGNHYDYAYDGKMVKRYSTGAIPIRDLLEVYERVLFWSTSGNFGIHEWRKPIDAVWKNIRIGRFERLSEIESLAIQERFDVKLSENENAARGWEVSSCLKESVCITFNADKIDKKVLSHLRFLVKQNEFATMPKKWLLQASNDKHTWQTLQQYVDDREWTKLTDVNWPPYYRKMDQTNQNRVYQVNNRHFYPHYRLVFPQKNTLNNLPGQIIAYAGGGCATSINVAPIQIKFIESTHIEYIKNVFWEATGDFPKTLSIKTNAFIPNHYILSTGNHGKDSWPRMPRSWRLEASNDEKKWTELDRHIAAPVWHENEKRSFLINNDKPYKFFRLIVDETYQPGVVRIYKFNIDGDGSQNQDDVTAISDSELASAEFYEHVGLPLILQSTFKRPEYISNYRMYSGKYGADSTGRMPKNWYILASVDGKQWKIVDEQTNQNNWKNNERRVYKLKTPGRYKFIRLAVNSTNDQSGVFRLTAIRFYTPRTIPPGHNGYPATEFVKSNNDLPIGLQTEFKQTKEIATYRLIAGPHGTDSIKRMPKNWSILASNDGKNWQTIDNQSNQDTWQNGEHRIYNLKASVRYKYLRLMVTDVEYDAGIMPLHTIKFFPPIDPSPEDRC